MTMEGQGYFTNLLNEGNNNLPLDVVISENVNCMPQERPDLITYLKEATSCRGDPAIHSTATLCNWRAYSQFIGCNSQYCYFM
uniref:Uncharacterized protein n=1 Tax=Arundo donax TaxID=35708 RepID=A0A0A9GEX9_ARUDO